MYRSSTSQASVPGKGTRLHFGGESFWEIETFRIVDGRQCSWVMDKDFHQNFSRVTKCNIFFFRFSLASLTESSFFWCGLKYLFPFPKLDDKVIINR